MQNTDRIWNGLDIQIKVDVWRRHAVGGAVVCWLDGISLLFTKVLSQGFDGGQQQKFWQWNKMTNNNDIRNPHDTAPQNHAILISLLGGETGSSQYEQSINCPCPYHNPAVDSK